MQVSAVDEDNSHRGDSDINYTLAGPGSSVFHMSQRTGHISLTSPLDYEARPVYSLVATASDRGTPPRNTSVSVTITVDDMNDNPPVFVLEHYSVSLPEDYPSSQEFLRVNATDADAGRHGELRYSITSGNSDGLFINVEGGLVLMEGMHLDYEAATHHRLILRAMDCQRCDDATPRLSAFVTVDIQVRPSFCILC